VNITRICSPFFRIVRCCEHRQVSACDAQESFGESEQPRNIKHRPTSIIDRLHCSVNKWCSRPIWVEIDNVDASLLFTVIVHQRANQKLTKARAMAASPRIHAPCISLIHLNLWLDTRPVRTLRAFQTVDFDIAFHSFDGPRGKIVSYNVSEI